MQFVGTHEVFGYLADVAVGIGGYQFGADGGVHYVEQGQARVIVHAVQGYPLHQVLHQSLGHAGIDAIHGDVVAVVGGPSQCQFGEVAGTYYESVGLVGYVHQYLRAFAGLRVFVDHVVVLRVVPYVFKVLQAGGLDADLAYGDTERLHQLHGIGVGAVGGAKAGHGDADDVLARPLQLIEGAHAYQQGQGRVEAARYAHYGTAGVGVDEALCQARHLYAEDFLAAFVQCGALRYEGMRVEGAGQYKVLAVDKFGSYAPGFLGSAMVAAGSKGGVLAALVAQAFHVNFADDHLFLQGETLAGGQQSAVFVDKSVSGKDKVGG